MPVHDGEVEGPVLELVDGCDVIGSGIIDQPVALVGRMVKRNVTVCEIADVAPLEVFLDNLEPAGSRK